ncbi:hypothetical protein M3223_19315 [Paenibacillus pasadenensis]|nr:hypothetical protein [Paenibacillus pasadenensis]
MSLAYYVVIIALDATAYRTPKGSSCNNTVDNPRASALRLYWQCRTGIVGETFGLEWELAPG